MDDSCPGCPRCGLAMVAFGEPVDGWQEWLCPMDDETWKTRAAQEACPRCGRLVPEDVGTLVMCEMCVAATGAVQEREPTPVCGKRCDHGSECLLLIGHDPPDRHETQHGCVFYAARPSERKP